MASNPFNRKNLTQDILNEWQILLDETAEMLEVPAGLITRVDDNEIEILLSSKTRNNPYQEAYTSPYPDSGWYCEHTLKSRGLNLIPNAFLESQWENNPAAVELHMISYAGVPIERPDGGQFGTVCFLDNKQNAHNEMHIKLIMQIKKMIELSLRIIAARDEIHNRDRLINDLSKIFPICSYCKKVRDDTDNWISVEKYVSVISGALPSHSICPQCYKKEIDNKFQDQ